MFRVSVLFLFSFCCHEITVAQDFLPSEKFITLTPQKYEEKLNATENKLIIDVRTKGEYKKAHIKNAQNISYLGSTFAEKAAELDNTKPVFIYCETAHRSPLAARILSNLGFKEIYDLQFGFENWRNQNMPMER
ncbi:MAG: Thiosulfate sulfurtransferase GlpE [Bacteroidia bacterium]|nr:Thiosulfate sulfurtransferase GlpE [Bacteroidia bacterium]